MKTGNTSRFKSAHLKKWLEITRAAAGIFIGMIQSLALRMSVSLRQRELLLHEAFQTFALFRTGMTAPSK